MPPPALASRTPSFIVDGLDRPALQVSLQSLVVTRASATKAILEATFNDWGPVDGGSLDFLWSTGRILRTGAKLDARIGADTVFTGAVAAVKSVLVGSAPPVFALRAEGRAPTSETGSLPRSLRWGSDLLRLDVSVERSGPTRTTGRMDAEVVVPLALGRAALRPGMSVDVLGMGAMFEGTYVLKTVSLHFDVTRGLRAELAAQR